MFEIKYQIDDTHHLIYEMEPTIEDYMDYLMEDVINTEFPDKATWAWARLALGEFIIEFDLKSRFEEDGRFKEFLKERYRDKAMVEIQ